MTRRFCGTNSPISLQRVLSLAVVLLVAAFFIAPVAATVSTQEELEDAINSVTVGTPATIELDKGEYKFTTNPSVVDKEITFKGSTDAIIDFTGLSTWHTVASNAKLTFEGVTVTFIDTDKYKGLGHTAKVVYKNCIINGQQCLYADDVEFIGCTFENYADYCIWTWAADNVIFTDCDFKTGGKAVLVYHDETVVTNVTLKNCMFYDDGTHTDKLRAAVETGDNDRTNPGTAKYNIIINGCTYDGFDANNSPSPLWGNKNNMPAERLNVVVVDMDDITLSHSKYNGQPLTSNVNDVFTTTYGTAQAVFGTSEWYEKNSDGDYVPMTEAPKNVGEYRLKVTASVNGYDTFAVKDVILQKATITVIPVALTKVSGSADPELTYTYSGNAADETPAFTGLLSRAEGEDAGTYPISLGTLALDNNGMFNVENYNLALSTEPVSFTITAKTPEKTEQKVEEKVEVKVEDNTATIKPVTGAGTESTTTTTVTVSDSGKTTTLTTADSGVKVTLKSEEPVKDADGKDITEEASVESVSGTFNEVAASYEEAPAKAATEEIEVTYALDLSLNPETVLEAGIPLPAIDPEYVPETAETVKSAISGQTYEPLTMIKASYGNDEIQKVNDHILPGGISLTFTLPLSVGEDLVAFHVDDNGKATLLAKENVKVTANEEKITVKVKGDKFSSYVVAQGEHPEIIPSTSVELEGAASETYVLTTDEVSTENTNKLNSEITNGDNAAKFSGKTTKFIEISLVDNAGNSVTGTAVTFYVKYSVLGISADDAENYNFVVLHLKSNGEFETVPATPTDKGLKVGPTTTSPFAIGYSEKVSSGSSKPQGTSVWLQEIPTETPTPTVTPTETQPEQVPTTAPTTQPTTEPETPGFGVLAVLAGLGAAAVLRRK